jgi:hypothetical protein
MDNEKKDVNFTYMRSYYNYVKIVRESAHEIPRIHLQ